MRIPSTLLYSTEHLWTKLGEDGLWEAGITDYAQDLLGDVVFIDPPKVGAQLSAGTPCGLVESVKTGSDLHALVDGEVVAINQELLNAPELINDKPYQAWIFKFKTSPSDLSQSDLSKVLLSADAYQTHISGL